jgi:hypothetical protein
MCARLPFLAFPALVVAFASPGAGAEARIGAHAGVGFFEASREVTNPGLASSSRMGLSAGAVLALEVAGRVNVWLEPGYVQKGTDIVLGHGASLPVPNEHPVKSGLRFSYLELPVLARGSFGSGPVRPCLVGGMAVSWLLDARVPGAPDSITGLYRRWDVGLSLGAGIEMGRGRTRGFLEARYTLGLLNIEHTNSEFRGSVRNRGGQLLAGITFGAGG